MGDQSEIQKDQAELLEYLGTDGERWTEQFLTYTDLANAGPDFVATVHSWFANAIEAGRTAGFSSLYEELKHAASNHGFDTSDFYSPGQLAEGLYQEIPEDHRCL